MVLLKVCLEKNDFMFFRSVSGSWMSEQLPLNAMKEKE